MPFALGAKSDDEPVIDCISTAQPTWLTKEEICNLGALVQVLVPEHDGEFVEELKAYTNQVIQTLGETYDYQFFLRLEHAFATRGDPNTQAEREGMERANDATVLWFR